MHGADRLTTARRQPVENATGMAKQPRFDEFDERDLVRRMLSGDEDAYDYFSRHHIPPLFRFAIARLGGNTQLASDIVQTTLCKALAKLATYRGDGPLFGWLCSCCRNEIGMHFRRAPRELELDREGGEGPMLAAPVQDQPDNVLLAAEVTELVHLVLDLIPEGYARILGWKYVDGATVREIADRLALSEKAAESLLTRARGAFREAWKRQESASRGEVR